MERFWYSPWQLFIAAMASWVVYRAALAICTWLGWPGLALCLTLATVSAGFAFCVLSALDWRLPFSRQGWRVLAAVGCWAGVGTACLRLF